MAIHKLSRGDFLKASGAALPAWFVTPIDLRNWRPRLAFFTPPGADPTENKLVVIFQRGGIDGLNVVIPHAEPHYYRARPQLAVPEPRANDERAAIDLDGFFSLHPSLRPLLEIWEQGDLAIVHACGSPDPTHSHFDAMDYMERGTPGEKQIPTGWLARHLKVKADANESPFRAVGIGSILPASLRGPVPATALRSIADFHLGGRRRPDILSAFQQQVADLYAAPGETVVETALSQAAERTLAASDTLNRISAEDYRPISGIDYPASPFGQALRQVAQLIKAEVGLEVAAVDIGGWDTHVNQGAIDGLMPGLLTDLAASMAAFYHDLVDWNDRITVVTMSEFGRRLQENGGGGTDHGHGSVMFLMGGGLKGRQVYGKWPGLNEAALSGPGDLAITTDFRDVLGEIIQTRLGNDRLEEVFPGYEISPFAGIVAK